MEGQDPARLPPSQALCRLECRLKAALRACGCAPWHLPLDPAAPNSTRICDNLGRLCFLRLAADAGGRCPASAEDDCLPDCQKVMFSVSSTSRRIDARRECSSKRSSLNRYLRRGHGA